MGEHLGKLPASHFFLLSDVSYFQIGVFKSLTRFIFISSEQTLGQTLLGPLQMGGPPRRGYKKSFR
jgi:hypothetical protein